MPITTFAQRLTNYLCAEQHRLRWSCFKTISYFRFSGCTTISVCCITTYFCFPMSLHIQYLWFRNSTNHENCAKLLSGIVKHKQYLVHIICFCIVLENVQFISQTPFCNCNTASCQRNVAVQVFILEQLMENLRRWKCFSVVHIVEKLQNDANPFQLLSP